MNVTVKDLLELPIMQNGSKLLSDTGLDNIVQYVTVVEAPKIHFPNYGGHIFVLTTLSAYSESLDKINEFVRRLCEVSISAIGIKLGRFVNEIDPSTIQIAAEHHVALFALDPSLYFREIISEVLSVITGNQRITLNKINHLNQNVIEAIIQNHSIQDLLNVLSSEITCYCCCLNPAGGKIAESSSLKGPFDTRQALAFAQRFFQENTSPTMSYAQEGSIFIFPCVLQEKLLAAVCIVAADPTLDLVIPLCQAIVSGICVKFLEENLKTETERGLISSMLDDILFSHHSDSRAIAERLELLNFVPRKYHTVILLSHASSTRDYNWINAVDNVDSVFAREFTSAITFKRGGEYIVLASYLSDGVTARLGTILAKCQSTLSVLGPDSFEIGCGIPITDLSQIGECYRQAKEAVRFGQLVSPGQHVYLYNSFFELGLIYCGVGSCESQIFYDRIISPIQSYDRQAKSDLWPTLEASFRHDKLEQVAEALHIHISTLRYRLQKIQSLTGYNYFNSRDRMTLYLAVLLFQVSSDLTSWDQS